MIKNPIFLHVGNNVSVRKKDVICILEPDHSTVSRVTRDYVRAKQADGSVKVISPELPGAFIVISPVSGKHGAGGSTELCISHISAATLADRA